MCCMVRKRQIVRRCMDTLIRDHNTTVARNELLDLRMRRSPKPESASEPKPRALVDREVETTGFAVREKLFWQRLRSPHSVWILSMEFRIATIASVSLIMLKDEIGDFFEDRPEQ